MSGVRGGVVMGVSGSGKTTLARALAGAWEATFLDADDFHSDEARELMARGEPLTDEMRQPWAAGIATELQRRVADGARVTLAFSGLRRQHRDLLRAAGLPLQFLFLRGEAALIGERMRGRSGHYMPVSLLDSQFATLEEPGDEDDVVVLPVDLPPDAQLRLALQVLGVPLHDHLV
ncbi:gluconokinase [Pseudoxanthomonas yeongjuensis]|uniref:gluconokinase n=1 Tax=Pseudoxanthomonas yeongjuensis TaxID=377616 RepID=UPI001390B57C|nr:gluconokinase, GntK/IdnK-type [Pseudoxanthomonas yeongjuensis]KAF1715559.1 gluconokinase [Pseudoxanthomonas yeongjuensis]